MWRWADLADPAEADAVGAAGSERLGEWKKLVGNRPLVAIGGLTLERALLCLSFGADIVSVVGAIVNHADPIGQTKAWLAGTRGMS
jgi:thiamine-phosphate pyrophosphorylase